MSKLFGFAVVLTLLLNSASAGAQAPGAAARPVAAATVVAALPADYVIGPEDVLGVLFWRDPDMSGDVTVRPDGKITLPLIGEVLVSGLKPDVLREEIQKASSRLFKDANATVVVRQINSRKIFITGQVGQPGAFPLAGPRNVLQLIALAGGLNEYAEADKVTIIRSVGGRTETFKFNYKDVSKGKKLEQNIQLQPGDIVVVP